jgi:hypothetical protein
VPPSNNLTGFQQACVERQRRSISGDTRPLDEESEARSLAFCDCVAQKVTSHLSPQDTAAIALDQGSPALAARLEAIFALCRLR